MASQAAAQLAKRDRPCRFFVRAELRLASVEVPSLHLVEVFTPRIDIADAVLAAFLEERGAHDKASCKASHLF